MLNDFPKIPRYSLAVENIEAEIKRFHLARLDVRTQIESRRLLDGHSPDVDELLESHLLMIDDSDFHTAIEGRLRLEQINVEWALQEVVSDLIARLRHSANQYLRERSSDLLDILRQLLDRLLGYKRTLLSGIDEEVIVAAYELLPSDFMGLRRDLVRGIAMEVGSRTSHSAILARSLNIPTVAGVATLVETLASSNGSTVEVIVDGSRGLVIIAPDRATQQHYVTLQQEWQRRGEELTTLTEKQAETTDGKRIAVCANIESPDDIDIVHKYGSDGIGLFRSEFLFLQSRTLPSEQEQFEAYSRVLSAFGDRPVTIRTLDIGGDKYVPELMSEQDEANPFLGLRSIRLCLSNIPLFKTQLRALLRASVHGRPRIMFPMISSVEELGSVLAVLKEVEAELDREGIPRAQNIPIGAMIEVPSAAMTVDLLARKIDFLSIGTNDLIQYAIAVDRGNASVAYLYKHFHPAIVRLLKRIVDDGHRADIEVAMCGEMAGDPLAIPLLIGLGLDELSMSAAAIPECKDIICSVSMAKMRDLAQAVLEMDSATEIEQCIIDAVQGQIDLAAY